jgi:hypothetical protein
MRLTLRTLLSWKDGMLGDEAARDLAAKVEGSDAARRLVARIEEVSGRPTVSATAPDATGFAAAANSTAEYLDNVLPADRLGEFERVCFASDAQLAETAATHELLAELSRSPPAPLDAKARKRLLAVVQARAVGADRPGLEQQDAVTIEFPAARRAGGAVPARPPRPASAPTAAWLLVAAAVLLLAALVGVLGWSLTKGGRRAVAHRDVAVKPAAPVVPAADPPPAAPPAAAVVDPPPPAAEPAPPAVVGGGEASALAVPEPPQPNAAVVPPVAAPAEAAADEFPPPAAAAAAPVAQPAAEPVAAPASADPATAVVTVPVPPGPVAGDQVGQRVPQGDALAIAAPPARPEPRVPEAVAPRPAAADANPPVAVAGRDVVLFRAQGAAAEPWLAGADRVPLAPPVDLVAPPFCRPLIVIDGVRIALEPGTRAVLTRDADGTPRLELVFGAAAVAGPKRLGLTVGGLSGEVVTDVAVTVGVEATLVRPPGATAATTQRVARIRSHAGGLAWRPAASADGAADEQAAGVVDVAAGEALAWRSDAPAGTSVEAAGSPPAWLAGRPRDDSVDRWAADALGQGLVAGTGAVPALVALAADRRPELRVAAASTLALVGEFDELARLLVADGREALRDGLWSRLDEVAVQPALARGPRAAEAFAQAIAAHAPAAADTIVRFAHGLADDELAAGAAEELVAALESPHLVVRRYAIKNLLEITGADGVDRLKYRADRPVESLREGAAWWRARLEQGRIRRGVEAAAASP